MAREAEIIISGNRTVRLRMPNLYSVLAKAGIGAPNPALASVIKLLEGAGALSAPNELQRLTYQMQHYRGLYEIAALCLIEPRLNLNGPPGEGEIGPDDLAFNDLFDIYLNFFRSDPTPAESPAQAALVASVMALHQAGADSGTITDVIAGFSAARLPRDSRASGGADADGAEAAVPHGDHVSNAAERADGA